MSRKDKNEQDWQNALAAAGSHLEGAAAASARGDDREAAHQRDMTNLWLGQAAQHRKGK